MPALLLLLALFQPAPPSDAQAEAERLFALGRRLFDTGDAAGAVAAFEGAAATGWTAGALEYDWGTACLTAGDLGCAVLHLERAQRRMPDHEAVAHNLRLARERAGVEARPSTPSATLRRGPGGDLLLGLGLALYLGTVTLAGYRLWTRRPYAWLRRALVVLVPLNALALGLGVWAWADGRAPEAVVVAEASVHEGPGGEAEALLAPGHLIRVLGRRGDWVEVRLPEGDRGWLPARAVEEI